MLDPTAYAVVLSVMERDQFQTIHTRKSQFNGERAYRIMILLLGIFLDRGGVFSAPLPPLILLLAFRVTPLLSWFVG